MAYDFDFFEDEKDNNDYIEELELKKKKEQKENSFKIFTQNLILCVLVAIIPAMTLLVGVQAKHFIAVQREIEKLESKQYEIINSNKQLVTGISILSNPQRIEKLAIENINMEVAPSEKIVRVKLNKKIP